MSFQTYSPQAPLSSFIAYFWSYTGKNPPHSRRLTLPDGSIDLVIDLYDRKTRIHNRYDSEMTLASSVISGPHTDYYITDSSSERSMIGVHIKPGCAGPLLKLPSIALKDTHVSLDDLWGIVATDLRDELLYSNTVEDRFRILEKYFLLRSDWSRPSHSAVEFAIASFQQSHHPESIANMVEQVNMSAKRFIQIFKDEVGLTPKRFSRLMRFQKAVRLIRKSNNIDWADLAMSCEYYDQSHFIKEFQSFSGLTPTEYRAIESLHPNHIPLTN
ncbi:DUF6597 domain-containing transcriptional factor [Paenibacillus cellulositrophicus]|uniref:DUF6597 domain-containing transcriptional factor n=1 Tax=Paenibacillus cellulositrophicus TaxID=562959 RepID=UPI003D98A3ED